MSIHDINKAYVSPIDRFLFDFDAKHNNSASQLEEIKKHQRLFELRDNPNVQSPQEKIWTEF